MTTIDLRKLARSVADRLNLGDADYSHEIVEGDGGVTLYTIDRDDPDGEEVCWGSRADAGVLFVDTGLRTSSGESIVLVNGIAMGSASPKAIAAMLLGLITI